jgi:YD repeat-containing protein
MGCRELQLNQYFRLIRPEENHSVTENTSSITDPKGRATTFTYDALDLFGGNHSAQTNLKTSAILQIAEAPFEYASFPSEEKIQKWGI